MLINERLGESGWFHELWPFGSKRTARSAHARGEPIAQEPKQANKRFHLHWVSISESAKSARKIMAGDCVHTDLKFGPFELSASERVLRRDGVALPLGSRALDILIYLSEHPGEVISKQQLLDHVWSDVTVEEGSLRVHVSAIRKALGDGKFGNRYIANIQGRGYSFVGTVAGVGNGATDTAPRRYHGPLPARPRRMVGREQVLREV